MKKILCMLFAITIATITFAQPQQGIVKTRGRMVNGELVAGQKLSGATITLNIGNPLVSGDDGAFSFNVPTGKNYSLVTAKKQGYTLADPEYIHRTFAYSASNPFYVVLEDEAQRQADINAATRKVRRTLTAQLQAREDEIEALKEQNKLTEAEYQKRLQELYDNQSKSEQLVKEMAERYASTDYDQLDEFNRQVQMYIEEGELQKADSMIRSKGDMEKRVAEYHSIVAANKKEREHLEHRRQSLEHSESGAARTYEDISQDLLRRSEIFLQTYKQDSALYCLKMRADLDTTNVEAVKQYAILCYDQRDFINSKKYFLMCYRFYENSSDTIRLSAIQHNLGALYDNMHDYMNSERYYMLALENREKLYDEHPIEFRKDLAITQDGLGTLYGNLGDYVKSEKYYKLALENKEQLFSQYPQIYRVGLARTQSNLAHVYMWMHEYENCEKYNKLALENQERLFEQDSELYAPSLARTQTNLAQLYRHLHNYETSEFYYKLSLNQWEHLFEKNPSAHRTNLIRVQNEMGSLYAILGKYELAENYYIRALENIEYLFGKQPTVYLSTLAIIQSNIGLLYSESHNDKAERFLKLALENQRKLLESAPKNNRYRAEIAATLNSLGNLYKYNKDYDSSEQYYRMSLEHIVYLYQQNPAAYKFDMMGTLDNLLYIYKKNNRLEDAIVVTNEMIVKNPDNPNLYDIKDEILLMQGKNDEALAMWKKVLELNPNFLKDNPDGTNLSNSLKKLGLIE